MFKNYVTVVARITARAGKEARVKEELKALLEPTRKESGCVLYDLHEDPNNRAEFMFYETWVDKQALDDHFETPHIKNIMAKAEELFLKPVEISLWAKSV